MGSITGQETMIPCAHTVAKKKKKKKKDMWTHDWAVLKERLFVSNNYGAL